MKSKALDSGPLAQALKESVPGCEGLTVIPIAGRDKDISGILDRPHIFSPVSVAILVGMGKGSILLIDGHPPHG